MQRTITDPDMGDITFRKQTNNKHYVIHLSRGVVIVSLPLYGTYQKAMDFYWENRENLLLKYKKWKEMEIPVLDEKEVRKTARPYLSERLAKLASEHGFHYTTLRITKSRTRWGTCSSKGTISLSLYLTLLPEHLVDYVLLHELCHTIQMNHSSKFWDLLDKHTDGKAKTLRKELKAHAFS